jgi:hypothetical protein
VANRKLVVEIVGDASSLQRALGNAASSGSRFGSVMGKVGKIGLAAGAAITGGLVVALKQGFDEISESQKVMAQTEAVIKSTGGTAQVTAKQVTGLAESLSQMSGVDDEVIQGGENMLLTFTNIRNEVGEGNDVFNQATATLLDMSTALGTDMNKSAIQLGKALNDPIKGITALQRVGVSFTEGQKETIKKMVETGDVMGAQKLILGELNREFGGSAKAFGETLPGQLAKTRNAFDEVAGNVAMKLLPMLTGLLDWVNSNWPTIEAVINAGATAIQAAFDAIGVAVNWLRTQWDIHRESVITAWNAVQNAIMRTIEWIRTNIVPIIQGVITAAIAIWDRFGGEIMTILTRLAASIKGTMQNMLAPMKIILALIRGDWSTAWNEIKGVVTRTLGGILANIKAIGGALVSAAVEIGRMIVSGILAGLAGLANKVGEQMQKVWDALKTAATTAYNFAFDIGGNVIDGIWNAIKAKISWLKGKIEAALGFLKDLSPFSSVEEGGYRYIGKPIMDGAARGVLENVGQLDKATRAGVRAAIFASKADIAAASRLLGVSAVQEIINGVVGLQPTLTQQLKQALADATSQAMEAAKQKVLEKKGELAAAFGSMASAALAAFDAVTAGWKSPAERALEKMRLEDQIKAVNDAVADAQSELDRLIAESAAASQQRQALGLAPPSGMDPEEWQKQVEAAEAIMKENGPRILAAQEQLEAAKRALVEFNLEQQAKAEREAYLAKRAEKRTQFEEEIANLAGWAARHSEQHELLQEKIRRLWAKFGIEARQIGKTYGKSIAKGLYDSIPEIITAAQAVAQAIRDNTQGKSPTKEGPLSKVSPEDAGRDYSLGLAKGIRSALPTLNSAFAGIAAAPTLNVAAGGGATIVVPVYLDGRPIAEVVTQHQFRMRRSGAELP